MYRVWSYISAYSLLLIAGTAVALIWANLNPESYHAFVHYVLIDEDVYKRQAYYDWLNPRKVSRPLWVLIPLILILIPAALVLKQPNLGNALVILATGGAVMLIAGVSLWYFGTVLALVVALVFAVFESKGTDWQLIEDYQFRRIDTFLDPRCV